MDRLLTTVGPGASSPDECVCANLRMERVFNGTAYRCVCPAGTYFCEECDHCMPCPAGTYRSTSGLEPECVSCSDSDPHLTTVTTGATSFAECACKHTSFDKAEEAVGGQHCLCPQGSQYDLVTGRCVPCPEDTYKDTVGNTQCLPCSPALRGFIGEEAVGESTLGACVCGHPLFEVSTTTPTRCLCPRGYEFNSTVDHCTECLPGYYKNSTSRDACTPCPPGTYREVAPADECLLCAPGYYSPEPGARVCTEWCSAHTFSQDGAEQCSTCGDTDFSLGGDCTDGVFNGSASGFWTWDINEGAEASALQTARFYSCPEEWACQGGVTSACAGGRTGVLCGVCPHNTQRLPSGRCEECADTSLATPVSILTAITFVLVLIAGAFARGGAWIVAKARDEEQADEALAKRPPDPAEDEASTAVGLVDSGDLPPPLKWRRVERVKLLLTHVQVLAALLSYKVDWPCAFAAVLRPLKISIGDISVIPLSCLLREDNWFKRYALKEAILLAALMCTLRPSRFLERVFNRLLSPQSFRLDAALHTARMAIAFVVFPAMCINLVELYTCVDLGVASFLEADLSVNCASPDWRAFAGVGGVYAMVHVVGILFFFAVCLLRAQQWPALPWEPYEVALRQVMSEATGRRDVDVARVFAQFELQQRLRKPFLDHLGSTLLAVIYQEDRAEAAARITDGGPSSRIDRLRDKPTTDAFGFLYAALRPEYWWWEAVDCARKMFLIALVRLAAPGSMTQLMVGLCLAMVYALLVATLRPYAHPTESRLAQACNVSACLLLAGGMSLRAGHESVDVLGCGLLSIPFLVAALTPFAVALLPYPAGLIFAPLAPIWDAIIYAVAGDEVDEEDIIAANNPPGEFDGVTPSTSRAAHKQDITEEELAEAQEALDDFLGDDSAFIFAPPTARGDGTTPRGGGGQAPDREIRRPPTLSISAGESRESLGTQPSPGPAKLQRTARESRESINGGQGRAARASRDNLHGGPQQQAMPMGIALPPAPASSGPRLKSPAVKSDRRWGSAAEGAAGDVDTEQLVAHAAAAARVARQSQRAERASVVLGGGTNRSMRQSPPVSPAVGGKGKADRTWRYSVEDQEGGLPPISPAKSPARGGAKVDRAWRYSQQREAGQPPASPAKSPARGGAKVDRAWRYSDAQASDAGDPGPSARGAGRYLDVNDR